MMEIVRVDDVNPVILDKTPVKGAQLAVQQLPRNVGFDARRQLSLAYRFDVKLGTAGELNPILNLFVGVSRERSNQCVDLVSLIDQIGAQIDKVPLDAAAN